jgi:ABC-type polysaccharide/polyol phosphate export permease
MFFLFSYKSLVAGSKLWRLSMILASTELKQKYRRTYLGRIWISLSFFLFIFVKIIIFSSLNGENILFFSSYLAIGYMIFRFISGAVSQGSNTFVSQQGWIKAEPLPLTFYIFTNLYKNLISMLYMAVPTLIICLFSKVYILGYMSIILAFLVYIINFIWVSLFLSIIVSRYRDVSQILSTLMQIMYFATPILWVPGPGIRGVVAFYNPFSHYIAILRDPFVYGTAPYLSWAVVLSITVIGTLIAAFAYNKTAKKIVFWI